MGRYLATVCVLVSLPVCAARAGDASLDAAVAAGHAHVQALYVELHQHPELHDQERWTGARMAQEMRAAGFAVKDGIGGHGVIGVLENGNGPTLLLRTIMDALPVAESILGARKMIADGLVDAIPKPDFIVAYHLLPDYSSRQVAWVEGDALAGSETAEIVVRGIPGHASFPADAKDPVPLVTFFDNGIGSTFNDPKLTARAVSGFQWALGNDNVVEGAQLIGTDETVAFAHAWPSPVPMMFFFYGSSPPEALAAWRAGGEPLPSLHAPEFAPDVEATLQTGTKALVGAVVGILPP